VTHLLVTNDFPPKVGGIQAYLWELWRRFDPETFVVLTAQSHPDALAFDREQAARGIRIERVAGRILVPTPQLAHRIRETARRVGAGLAVIDPAFPLGVVGPRLGLPYAVLLHGAEVAIPGRLPAGRELLAHVLRRSSLVVSAGGYPAAEASRALRGRGVPPVVEIPPGVDLDRFRPLSPTERSEARRDLGLPIAAEAPFTPITNEAFDENMELITKADVVILTEVPIGTGNFRNINALERASAMGKNVWVIKGVAGRDFTNDAVRALDALGGIRYFGGTREIIKELSEHE